MTKLEQMQRVESCGVVAIIRANSSAELIEVAAAIKAGGVDLIEVTMTTPNALSVISDVAARYGDEVPRRRRVGTRCGNRTGSNARRSGVRRQPCDETRCYRNL